VVRGYYKWLILILELLYIQCLGLKYHKRSFIIINNRIKDKFFLCVSDSIFIF